MALSDNVKGSELRDGQFVLLEQCAKCGKEFPEEEIRWGFCRACDQSVSGPLPAWAKNIPVDPAPGRVIALVPRVMRFVDIFETWVPLKEQVGSHRLDRRLAPFQTAWGEVSRYCSINLRGRELAIAVHPHPHILERVGPHITHGAEGICWRISAENGVGPRLRLDFLFRAIGGFGTLCYIALDDLERSVSS